MKLLFCGTPQFAVPTLRRLLAEGFDIPLVVTNPDERRGRGYTRTPPPVKEAALQAGLNVFQPVGLKAPEVQAAISEARPEAIVVVAYGHLIPPWMIDLPQYGCINLHASLLPRYRGAAPVAWAIIRGERKTGVTTMKIDPGLDTGDILLQQETEILDADTTETLSFRLSELGAALIAETLKKIERREVEPKPQDHSAATLAPALKKKDGWIDWSLKADEIARRVRALQPWPTAFTTFRGSNLQLWSAHAATDYAGSLPQGMLKAERGRLFVGCRADTVLEISEVQLAGRRRVSARDFINGVRPGPNEKIGS